jgi:hypothetical protein
MVVPVPVWNSRGWIDPIDVLAPTSVNRSPYVVSLRDFVLEFATTPRRASVLGGLLQYRSELHTAGLKNGFQWLDGSFLENVELLESRDPGDVDVVTYYQMPTNQTQASLKALSPDTFPVNAAEHKALKDRLHVDAYTMMLDQPPQVLVKMTAYWYSMWAHRRDFAWKGFVQVDLAPLEDALATAALVAQHLQVPPIGGSP